MYKFDRVIADMYKLELCSLSSNLFSSESSLLFLTEDWKIIF